MTLDFQEDLGLIHGVEDSAEDEGVGEGNQYVIAFSQQGFKAIEETLADASEIDYFP